MNSSAGIQAMQEAQRLYDLMEDHSWDDGDPMTALLDELAEDLEKVRELAAEGKWERVVNMADELIGTSKHIANEAQLRIQA